MKKDYCEKEQDLVAALHGGTLNAELLGHAASCPVCSEVLWVTEILREESASLDRELQLPDATVIWRKAQARAREKALAKATLPIRVVRTSAYAIAILAAPWMVLEFSGRPSWLPDLGLRHLMSVDLTSIALTPIDGNWLAALTGTMFVGITATLLGFALSSWYMLREE
ncbi:MAG: hypothetical protein ACLPHP_06030 [Candidatus Sulfotelmatobacter sp.]